MGRTSSPNFAPQAAAGPWAIGVSGGADSVALLLMLLERRKDIQPWVLHLDHELRGAQSTEDAVFVKKLATCLGLPCEIARRKEIEKSLKKLPANPSAKYRAARFAFFRNSVCKHRLNGVMLAHHADDLAETVLHRLIRGTPVTGLTPMRPETEMDGLRIVRPLLAIGRAELREYLQSRGQDWREDPSNAGSDYLRNRLRKILAARPELTPSLLNVALASADLADWIAANAPALNDEFAAVRLAGATPMLARHAARKWLAQAGSPSDKLSTSVLDRLIEMAADAATAARQTFPGNVSVTRSRGKIRGASRTSGNSIIYSDP
jgi:tRNA(Ile)-lysidine synthetase-like protein